MVQILFPLLDHPDHGDEGDDDERSNLPCLQITQKRSQRNLYLTTVLLGAEVGSIDIVGDNSRLVVGPGAGQGPTGSRDRGRAQQGTHANPPCSKSSSSSSLPIFGCYGVELPGC